MIILLSGARKEIEIHYIVPKGIERDMVEL